MRLSLLWRTSMQMSFLCGHLSHLPRRCPMVAAAVRMTDAQVGLRGQRGGRGEEEEVEAEEKEARVKRNGRRGYVCRRRGQEVAMVDG